MTKKPKVLSIFWHGVGTDSKPAEPDSKNPTAALFRNQLEYLVAHYTPISAWDFLKMIQGEDSVHSYAKPPVLLGFDDGFRSVIVNGLPILTEFRVPAIFFVVGEVLRDPHFVPWYVEMNHMTRKARHKRVDYRGINLDLTSPEHCTKLRRLFDAAFRARQSEVERQELLTDLSKLVGVPRPAPDEVDDDFRFVSKADLAMLGASSLLTVASHAMTHRYLATLHYEEQLYELKQSDSILREYSPSYCPVIAYPGGSFNAATIATARNIYKAGFAVFLGSSYRNRYAYPRISLGRHTAREVAYGIGRMRLNWMLPLKRWLHVTGLRKVQG